MPERFSIPRPPKGPVSRPEFPAIIEPRLRDIPEPPEAQIERSEPFESEPIDIAVSDELVRQCQEVALQNRQVAPLLGGKRYVIIGVSALLDDKEDRADRFRLVAYNYTDNATVEVELTGALGEFRVADIAESDIQPPPNDEEVETAIRLARDDPRVGDHLDKGFEATTILASGVDYGDYHYGSRQLNVGFGFPDERMPRIRALVDLTRERVLGVALDEDPEIQGDDRDE